MTSITELHIHNGKSKGEASTGATVEASSEKSQSLTKGILMSDSTATAQNNIAISQRAITVPFHGVSLSVFEYNGQPVTAMRQIVEGMQLTWPSQFRKLTSNKDRWAVSMMETPLPQGGSQSMLVMPLRKLPGWLANLEPTRIKDADTRARVIQYQNECDDVLWQYWNEGLAVNPRAFHVGPNDTLTKEEQDTLRGLIEAAAHRLSSDTKEQGKFILKAWSKLKSHFGVSYREIPRQEFTSALSIVTRHEAEFTPIRPIPNREPVIDLTDRTAMQHARQTAVKYFDDFRESVITGRKGVDFEDIPNEVLVGLIESSLFSKQFVVEFTGPRMSVHPLGPKAILTSPLKLAEGIKNGDIGMDNHELAQLSVAISTKLAGRVEHLEARLTKPKLEPELRQRVA